MIESRTGRTLLQFGVFASALSVVWYFAKSHLPVGDTDGVLASLSFSGEHHVPTPSEFEAALDTKMQSIGFPESLTDVTHPLTPDDLAKTREILTEHKTWVHDVIEEYRWVMTTDPTAKAEYQKLLRIEAELDQTLATLNEQSTGLYDLQSTSVRYVPAELREVYHVAAQLKTVDEYGYVWVDGAPKPINEIFGYEFAQSNESHIPRRAARAYYEFGSDMQRVIEHNPTIVEGHTADPKHPTSYAGHISRGHLDGTNADIIPDHPMTDDEKYKLVMASKDNEYYRIRFEMGSDSEKVRLRALFADRAVADGYFDTKVEADAWLEDRVDYIAPKYDPTTGRQISGTTGLHVHVVALGGIGPEINFDGPKPGTTLASR